MHTNKILKEKQTRKQPTPTVPVESTKVGGCFSSSASAVYAPVPHGEGVNAHIYVHIQSLTLQARSGSSAQAPPSVRVRIVVDTVAVFESLVVAVVGRGCQVEEGFWVSHVGSRGGNAPFGDIAVQVWDAQGKSMVRACKR